MANQFSLDEEKKISAGLRPVMKAFLVDATFEEQMGECIGWAECANEAVALMLGKVEPVISIPEFGQLPFCGAKLSAVPMRVESNKGMYLDSKGKYDLYQFYIPLYGKDK